MYLYISWTVKRLNRRLVAGCSLGHKSYLLHVSGWDMDQTKTHMSNNIFSMMISVILGITVKLVFFLFLVSFILLCYLML